MTDPVQEEFDSLFAPYRKIVDSLQNSVTSLKGFAKKFAEDGQPIQAGKTASVSNQIEYWSTQAVKFDLDGLAFTSDGISLLGHRIAGWPWESVLEKKLVSLADKYDGKLLGKIFQLPQSVEQQRQLKELAGGQRKLAIQVESALRASREATTNRQTFLPSNRSVDRQEVAALSAAEAEIHDVQTAAARLEAQLTG